MASVLLWTTEQIHLYSDKQTQVHTDMQTHAGSGVDSDKVYWLVLCVNTSWSHEKERSLR